VMLTQDGVEMESDTVLVAVEVLVVIAFAWSRAVASVGRSAEDAVDVQVHETGESETE
jgi:hypothetical protein